MDYSGLFALGDDGAIGTNDRSLDITSGRRFRPSSSRGQRSRPLSSWGQSSRPSSSRDQSSRPLRYRDQRSRCQISLGQRSLGQSSYQRTLQKGFPKKTRSNNLHPSENAGPRMLVMKLSKVMHEDKGVLNKDVIWLSTKKSGFQDCLSMQLSNRMKEKILLACGRLVQVDGARRSLIDILMSIIRSSFCDKIISLLSENLTKSSGENTRAVNQVSSCLHLINAFMDYIPRHS
uniref:Uncharacterized protein n=1 Tax=Ciona savignyi TaxID=51511 RepID=H2YV49_CIOSA